MNNLPNSVYSGAYKEGHVQGIAVDKKRGFVYYSFTTMFLKTDIYGNAIGSVINLTGHLGCITYDEDNNNVYASLELKHDAIGTGIISRTGKDPSSEDSFYIVSFDCDSIVEMNMDAERDNVMSAVYLYDVVRDYSEYDNKNGCKHRYGCSGIDGIALGPVFGCEPDSIKKIMVAYGIYSENSRNDNDYQVILQFDRNIFELYGKSLNQETPHHSGPQTCEFRYFFYTGNTVYGIQNLEYDAYTRTWFLAVYAGTKSSFDNFNMYYIDGKCSAQMIELSGREGETGLVLTPAKLGNRGKQENIYGSRFGFGQTGMASMGDGVFYFSHDGYKGDGLFYTNIHKYTFDEKNTELFVIAE